MVDGRLTLARLCALTGRHDEAVSWFAKAREVLTEQGASPLLAIVDYDEALMYCPPEGARRRRNGPGPYLEPARARVRSHRHERLGPPGRSNSRPASSRVTPERSEGSARLKASGDRGAVVDHHPPAPGGTAEHVGGRDVESPCPGDWPSSPEPGTSRGCSRRA